MFSPDAGLTNHQAHHIQYRQQSLPNLRYVQREQPGRSSRGVLSYADCLNDDRLRGGGAVLPPGIARTENGAKQVMRKKELRTAAKRRRKAYNHPSPWRKKSGKKK
jgi:hypothetical protein